MIKSLKYLVIILFGLFLSACGEKKQPEDVFKASWEVDAFPQSDARITDSTKSEHSIVLDVKSDEGPIFFATFFEDVLVKGSWEFNDSARTIAFSYVEPLSNYDIDSTVLTTDSSGNAVFGYYAKGVMVASGPNTELSLIERNISGSYEWMSDDHSKLKINLKGFGEYVFQKQLAEASGFSIMSILRGMLGMAFLLFVAYAFSANRSGIDWNLVGKGIALQVVIALLVLKAPFVGDVFDAISKGFVQLIGQTEEGIAFVFGSFVSGEVDAPMINFAFKVLPTIVFFSALMSLLYYWGILQKVVYAFAWVMKKFMRLSGAESLAAAGNVFLGQTEAPLLVKPFLMGMTKSELMCLMTGGMATIAGGVLASYIGYLGGDDPVQQAFFAKHLMTASVISAPAAIVAAKILVPEQESINTNLVITKDKIGTNALEAISNGTSDGLKLAVNVGAMLIVFIALVATANWMLEGVGNVTRLNGVISENTNYDKLSFEMLLGYACAPVAWLMGVDGADMVKVGELIGQKTVLNEFYAYKSLGEMKAAGDLSEKSVIMSTYMLCGFANIASIGIQIGGIGALIPTRKGLLSQLGVKALVGGTIACLLTAVVVGMTI